MLKISNQTEIEENAFMLMGACTKRGNSNKIGYFGSGLKYALAVLIREGIDVKIFSGLNEVKITLSDEILRNETFKVININGKKTNLTTDMGRKWKLWQAIREIYCNALDEDNYDIRMVEIIKPKAGETSFYISTSNPQVSKIITDWDAYFSDKREPITSSSVGKIFYPYNEYVTIYRKGIKCYDEHISSLYDYDFENIEINESRIVQYSFYIHGLIAQLWSTVATEKMIKKLIDVYRHPIAENNIEHLAAWNDSEVKFCNTWLNVLREKLLIPFSFAGSYRKYLGQPNAAILPERLIAALDKQFPDEFNIVGRWSNIGFDFCVVEKDKRQEYLINDVLKFFEEVKLPIRYPVEVAVFKRDDILGCAEKGTIYISPKALDLGKKKIATVIVEEVCHLESKQSDETRGFQDYLINQILTLLENYNGIFL